MPVRLLAGLGAVLATSIAFRLYRLGELPLGPYVDELVILVRTLQLSETKFDLFGHTPLMREGWVETPNLYLYFNLLILKLFGVSQTSLKLFSALPGVVSCIAIYLLSVELFSWRVAVCASLLFATSHWPVRLSRYGWDVSFMVMAFALALTLLIRGLGRRSLLLIYVSGVVAGISLFSYVAARIAILSIVAFLVLEVFISRERWVARCLTAFLSGLVTSAFPLLCYYVANPNAFWVRAKELSVFGTPDPWQTLLDSIWHHALMFHVHGSYYARDNIPGMAMMDPITGVMLLIGMAVMLKRLTFANERLIACAFFLNFLPGILTVSQEGPPYVYRTAALMIPAFLIVGYGLQSTHDRVVTRTAGSQARIWQQTLFLGFLCVAILTNFVQYFSLEANNHAAMRTMAYEQQLLGAEISNDDMATIVVGTRVLEKTEKNSLPDEIHPERNPSTVLPLPVSMVATIALSGRYDMNRSLQENVNSPRDLRFVSMDIDLPEVLVADRPTKILFHPDDREVVNRIRALVPSTTLRYVRDIHQNPVIGIAILNVAGNRNRSPP